MEKVKAHKPMWNTGYDGVTPLKFDQTVNEYLKNINFKSFSPSYKKDIKIKTKTRTIYIPRYVDLLFEKYFLKLIINNKIIKNKIGVSYAFDVRKSRPIFVKDALGHIKAGYTSCIKMDVVKFSESISINILIKKVKDIFIDPWKVKVLVNWIEQPFIVSKARVFKRENLKSGLPQGRPLAGLFCDIYFYDFKIDDIDCKLMRFVDDIFIFYKNTNDFTYITDHVNNWMEINKLKLHNTGPKNSKIIVFDEKSNNKILGYSLNINNISLPKSKIQKIIKIINKITQEENIEVAYKKLNNYVYGWNSIKDYGNRMSKKSLFLYLRAVTNEKDIVWLERHIIWKFKYCYKDFNFNNFFSIYYIWKKWKEE